MDAARLSIPVMTALQAVVEDATDFLKAISASEAKDALVAAISEGQAVYASEASTVDDIEAARQAFGQWGHAALLRADISRNVDCQPVRHTDRLAAQQCGAKCSGKRIACPDGVRDFHFRRIVI